MSKKKKAVGFAPVAPVQVQDVDAEPVDTRETFSDLKQGEKSFAGMGNQYGAIEGEKRSARMR